MPLFRSFWIGRYVVLFPLGPLTFEINQAATLVTSSLFVLFSHSTSTSVVNHLLIRKLLGPPVRFAMDAGSEEKTLSAPKYSSLSQLLSSLDYLDQRLVTPIPDFFEEPWYWGDITAEEATRIVLGHSQNQAGLYSFIPPFVSAVLLTIAPQEFSLVATIRVVSLLLSACRLVTSPTCSFTNHFLQRLPKHQSGSRLCHSSGWANSLFRNWLGKASVRRYISPMWDLNHGGMSLRSFRPSSVFLFLGRLRSCVLAPENVIAVVILTICAEPSANEAFVGMLSWPGRVGIPTDYARRDLPHHSDQSGLEPSQ
jgi:hypothetical protein